MRILVCGGRGYEDDTTFCLTMRDLNRERPITAVIEGGALGADFMARRWAAERGVKLHTFWPDWKTHGKAAGPIRNQRMLDEGDPDMVVAFPGGSGTADMIRRAEKAGVPVHRPDTAPL